MQIEKSSVWNANEMNTKNRSDKLVSFDKFDCDLIKNYNDNKTLPCFIIHNTNIQFLIFKWDYTKSLIYLPISPVVLEMMWDVQGCVVVSYPSMTSGCERLVDVSHFQFPPVTEARFLRSADWQDDNKNAIVELLHLSCDQWQPPWRFLEHFTDLFFKCRSSGAGVSDSKRCSFLPPTGISRSSPPLKQKVRCC